MKYTPEQHQFFREYIPGHKQDEIAAEFFRRFNVEITAAQVKSYKNAKHIKSGTPPGSKPGNGPVFPKEVQEFVKANNYGKTTKEMAELLSATFGRQYSVYQIKAIRRRLHLDSGLTGRFQKGHVPLNKGKKGVYGKGCEKSWFPKGHTPANKAKVGAEVMTTDGYVKVKIALPNKWRFKHIMAWEAKNGPVPKGYVLEFLDGDHWNCDVSNLTLATRAEHLLMSRQHLRANNAEITETALLVARLKIKTADIRRKQKKGVEK